MEWKAFAQYEVSEKGDVRKASNRRPCKLYIQNGYVRVQLTIGKQRYYRVHRLVAHLWHGLDLDSELQVDHIDGNPQNNHFTNLQVVSASLHRHLTCSRKWPLDTGAVKQCRYCRVVKSRSEFYRAVGIERHSSYCKSCSCALAAVRM